MIPGVPGGRVNPRQLKAAMKRMGIETENLEGVEEVVIRTATKEYVFKSAEVSAMTVQGQKTWQIVGEPMVMNRKVEGAAPERVAIPEEHPEARGPHRDINRMIASAGSPSASSSALRAAAFVAPVFSPTKSASSSEIATLSGPDPSTVWFMTIGSPTICQVF